MRICNIIPILDNNSGGKTRSAWELVFQQQKHGNKILNVQTRKDHTDSKKEIEHFKPDIIHIHNSVTDFHNICKDFGVPIVTTACGWHDLELGLVDSSMKNQIQHAIDKSDKYIVISPNNYTVAKKIGLRLPIEKSPVVFLPYPRVFDKTGLCDKMVSRKKLDLPLDKKIVLYCGVLGDDHRKRLDALIGGMYHSDMFLLVVGTGTELDRYKQLVDGFKVESRFMGFVDEWVKPFCYAASDVFCMPSVAEGWGVVYTEALFEGVPVVGYSPTMHTFSELLGDNGRYCIPYDISRDFHLSGLLKDTVEYSNTGVERLVIHKKIKELFSPDVCYHSYERIYKELMG